LNGNLEYMPADCLITGIKQPIRYLVKLVEHKQVVLDTLIS
jgi:hypothetical protein